MREIKREIKSFLFALGIIICLFGFSILASGCGELTFYIALPLVFLGILICLTAKKMKT